MTKTVAAGQTFALHGTLGVGHTLVADSGSPSYLAGAYVAVHTSALNQGIIELLAGPGYRNLDGATGATLRVTGTLTNSGLINADGGTDASGNLGAVGGAAVKIAHTGSMLNTGTIVLSGAAPDVRGRHEHTTGANLRDNGTLTNDGSLIIGGGAYSGHSGSATAVIGGLLTNAGLVDVGSASAEYGGRGGILRVLSTGTLVNNGQVEVGPTVGQQSAELYRVEGVATLQIAGQFSNNGVLDIYDGGGKYAIGAQTTIFSTGILLNTGALVVSGGFQERGTNHYFSASPATLTNQGVLTNLGTIELNGVGIDTGLLTNDGTIDAAGGSTSYYFYDRPARLDVAGTLMNAGTMMFGGGLVEDYPYSANGANLLDTGLIDNTGMITLAGAGDYKARAVTGATFTVAGVLTNAGTVMLDGGFAEASRFNTGATLSDTGVIDNTGTIILAGATEYKSGAITGAILTVAGVLTNAGLIEVNTGTTTTTATVQISGTLTNLGTIDCYGPNPSYSGTYGPGGVISTSGLLIDPGAITGAGTLDNTGIVSSGAAGVTTGMIDPTIFNTGVIDIATNGAFTIGGAVSGTGQISLAAGGVLTLNAATGYGQTVDFAGPESTLALADPAFFYATIEGLRPQTTIDFLKTAITSAQATGTTLALGLAAGGTLDFTLAAPLATYATLSLSSDLHGGTDLVVTGNSADLSATSHATEAAPQNVANLVGHPANLQTLPLPLPDHAMC